MKRLLKKLLSSVLIISPLLLIFSLTGCNKQHKEEPEKPSHYSMNRNAIHMLASVQDTISDSFIITTDDGNVIVVDGGHKFEADYFVSYLKEVTGQENPNIDAWFLTHPHNDHGELFNEIAENRINELTFDMVYLNYGSFEFYENFENQEAMNIISEFNRVTEAFPEKIQVLHDGDILNIGSSKITVLFTFDGQSANPNEESLVFRMDLGGKSIMFTGDAGVNVDNKVLANWSETGLIDCDIVKMAHHGQDGVSREFYEAVSPEICLWPTPTWVWDNRYGNLKTLEIRQWMEEIGVTQNYISWQGTQLINLG